MKPIIGKYKHYKGGEYELIGVARNSETLEEMVVYRALYQSKEFGNNSLWTRPVSEFVDVVSIDGKSAPRFLLIKD